MPARVCVCVLCSGDHAELFPLFLSPHSLGAAATALNRQCCQQADCARGKNRAGRQRHPIFFFPFCVLLRVFSYTHTHTRTHAHTHTREEEEEGTPLFPLIPPPLPHTNPSPHTIKEGEKENSFFLSIFTCAVVVAFSLLTLLPPGDGVEEFVFVGSFDGF